MAKCKRRPSPAGGMSGILGLVTISLAAACLALWIWQPQLLQQPQREEAPAETLITYNGGFVYAFPKPRDAAVVHSLNAIGEGIVKHAHVAPQTYATGARAIRNALRKQPADFQLLLHYAQMQFDLGEVEEYSKIMQKALENAKKDFDFLSWIHRSLMIPVIHEHEQAMEARHAQINYVLNYSLKSAMHRLPQLPVAQIHTKKTRTLGLFNCLASSVYQGANWKWQLEAIGSLYRQVCPELVTAADHVALLAPEQGQRGKIRVGFLMELLKGTHSVGKVIGPTISLLDPEKFEVFVFTKEGEEEDSKTPVFTRNAQHLRLPTDGRRARKIVASKELEVLVFAEVGEDPWTYFFGFSRLARVQVAFWGNLFTSGLSQIDYFITSELFAPPAESFSEQLVLFQSSTVFYLPPPALDESSHTAAQFKAALNFSDTDRLYVCFHNLHKFGVIAFDTTIKAILEKDSRAKFVVYWDENKTSRYWYNLLQERWRKALGPKMMSRVAILPMLSVNAYLRLHAAADVVLDPFPYGGGITSLDTFSVGAPIITAPSLMSTMPLTAGIYLRMGMHELIASDQTDYVAKAVAIANDGLLRARLRKKIRTRIRSVYTDQTSAQEWNIFLQAIAGA